ncbi:MAG: hypothetical protein ABS83_03815 [Rhodospirillales bacterium SCN 65-16]|nr:MAG: hypothetical protein ABS83_03815 [Rhodospirillales bacterium SCN 65-16]
MSSKGKSYVTKDGVSVLVPKLRFPEFQGRTGWRTKKLNSLLFEAKHRNRSLELGPADVLSVSGEHGCVNQIEFMGRSYAGATVKDYHVVENGDIVYTKSPLKKNPFGIIKENKGKRGIVSTLYAVYRPFPECCPTYLDHFFSVDYHLNSYLQPIVRKGAKNDMKVNNADVLKGDICVPGFTEQKKIADCLDAADALIAAQGRKVEALRAHKKGLMQQLFPLEGETQPRLRFPEFGGAEEWSEKSLDKLATIQSGATPSKANSEFWGGSIPWVSAKDMKRLFLEDSEEHISEEAVSKGARLVPKGTILLLTRGMTLLKDVPVCILSREMSFNQDVKGLRPKAGVNGEFLAWMLLSSKHRLLAMVNIAGHGTGKIDSDELKALLLRCPQPPEQQRIADCLTSLDDLISVETLKLDTLKTHKKGLMQQLFAQVGEAGA